MSIPAKGVPANDIPTGKPVAEKPKRVKKKVEPAEVATEVETPVEE